MGFLSQAVLLKNFIVGFGIFFFLWVGLFSSMVFSMAVFSQMGTLVFKIIVFL